MFFHVNEICDIYLVNLHQNVLFTKSIKHIILYVFYKLNPPAIYTDNETQLNFHIRLSFSNYN